MIHPLRIGILVGCNLILDGLAAKNSEKLDWKKSIADLLKRQRRFLLDIRSWTP
jgi:hypothetical protein